MTTRLDQRTQLRDRLNDAGATQVFTDTELNTFLRQAALSLYPTFFRYGNGTTTPVAGPAQTKPTAGVRLHYIGLKKNAVATRVRQIRGWEDGDTQAMLPKLGLDVPDALLVWAWTEGWDYPTDDGTAITVPKEYEEVVLLRAHISALERILSNRTKTEKYIAIQVRQGVTEEDVGLTLDALHQSWKEHIDRAVPLPELRK